MCALSYVTTPSPLVNLPKRPSREIMPMMLWYVTQGGCGVDTSTGKIGERGDKASMLLEIFKSDLSEKTSLLSRNNASWLCRSIAGTLIRIFASHCVVWFEKLLPRHGVPIVTTRRTEGLGSKKKHSRSRSTTSALALTCSSGLSVTVPQYAPPLGTVNIPQEVQPVRLRTSSWGLPVQFRVGVALDVLNQGMNRVSVLGEFTQPVNTKPGAGAGLEWNLANVGNSGFSLAARGSYTLQPDNNLDPGTGAGFTTGISTSNFSSDGLAVGGGVAYGRGNWHVGFDYAYRNLGALGGTNFLSFSVGW